MPRVAIPAGADGAGLTVAQYLAALSPVAGITPGRLSGTSYARDRSAMVRLSYEFNEHLQLSVKARIGRKNFHDNGQWRSVQNVTIPAGFAGNPFGVPVRLSKVFYDLPPAGSEITLFTQLIVRESTGGMFVVSDTQVRYHQPARLDDELFVTAWPLETGRASLTIRQQALLKRPSGNILLCEGSIRVGWVNGLTYKPARIPQSILEVLT